MSATVLRYNLLPSSDDTDDDPSTLYELAHEEATKATATKAHKALFIGDIDFIFTFMRQKYDVIVM